MLKKIVLTSLLLLISLCINAQQSVIYDHDLLAFEKALELYKNQQYLSAQTLFSEIQQQSTNETVKGDCAYYQANCAVRLNQQGADAMMEAFVTEYPTSVKRNDAYISVAHYYFQNGKYAYARKWFDKVDETSLSRSEQEQFYFNNGYTYFVNKRYPEAQTFFNRISNSEQYGAQAKYYLGYIAYEGDDYDEANKQFEPLKGNAQYAEGLSYYEADMNFKLGNFQKAIDLGLPLFQKSSPKEKSELAKIIGESYFNLANYEAAIPYLKAYQGRQGKWNNTDYYQLGYAFYKQKKYAEAIGEFNKIIDGNNAVAQNAYYHLAESYLKEGRKQEALNAFKNAGEMEFTLEIQEDAWYNYAKLSYEIGNSYQSVPEVLLSFIELYPNHPDIDGIRELLVDSYLTSKNYTAALQLLETNISKQNKGVYQKVAFFRGLELYNESQIAESLSLFEKSLGNKENPSFTARAIFWKAECLYQQNQFDKALENYQLFLGHPQADLVPEFTDIYYNLAYNYFKLKNYDEALTYFQQYVNISAGNNSKVSDALLRAADCHFIKSNYWPALEHYNNAIEKGVIDQDYATFQKAMAYGFVDRTQKKLELLETFSSNYPKSFLRDDAYYELGNTYLSIEEQEEAMAAYQRIMDELPGSSYVPKALMKQALMFDNNGKSNEALQQFKRVVDQYPASSEALQAVAAAKLIYIDLGRVNEYASWVSNLDFVQVENSELDNASYQAAERPYLENKTEKAKKLLDAYLTDFPNGSHALKAHFYLAKLYYMEGKEQWPKAIPHYQWVVDQQRNEFSEEALARISEIYLSELSYDKAFTYLQRLELEADYPQNIIFAQTNSMKALYKMEQFNKAIAYAETVLQNDKMDQKIQSDAHVIIARASIAIGDEAKAREAYRQVASIAVGKLAVEAFYYEAYFMHKEGQWQDSNSLVQKLAKDYAAYTYYGAKGLVLMAKNFYAMEDAFQATYILESVIKNFSQHPDVINEAKAELSLIKSQESKTNTSVETEKN